MNCCILEYCNVGKPYLRFRLPLPDGAEREVLLELEAHQLEDGALKNPQELAAMLAERLERRKLPPVEVRLRSAQIYKTVLSLPMMNRVCSEKLYKKERREQELRVQSLQTECSGRRYLAVRRVWRHALGTVFHTYYLPQETVHSVQTLLRLLGTRCRCVEPFGLEMQRALSDSGAEASVYIRGDSCTFVSMDGKQPVTMADFAFSSHEELKRRLLMLMTRHELEHGALTNYCLDADCSVDLSEFGLSPWKREGL